MYIYKKAKLLKIEVSIVHAIHIYTFMSVNVDHSISIQSNLTSYTLTEKLGF